jgi:hypothetical protein
MMGVVLAPTKKRKPAPGPREGKDGSETGAEEFEIGSSST